MAKLIGAYVRHPVSVRSLKFEEQIFNASENVICIPFCLALRVYFSNIRSFNECFRGQAYIDIKTSTARLVPHCISFYIEMKINEI